uniref:Splicing factor 45 n=1 Tax=Scapholeberis mucronata TaxID=202097 RepID=A0A4Y7NKQ3_9CRUS|nr:EOG090X0BIL [Scapholeberis mucronata]SVE93821.1 EOG090X0BIL [Scapholeberis mucronata]
MILPENNNNNTSLHYPLKTQNLSYVANLIRKIRMMLTQRAIKHKIKKNIGKRTERENILDSSVTQPKKEVIRRTIPSNNPVISQHIDIHHPKTEVHINNIGQAAQLVSAIIPKQERSSLLAELEWDPNVEYDPLHPTDYDKIVRERKERRGLEIEIEEAEKKRKSRDDRETKPRDRNLSATSGFAGRFNNEDNNDEEPPSKKNSTSGGVAIAPPPSLQEQTSNSSSSTTGAGMTGVAAKIMAKYGFKEGQGLGRQQQGIAAALQVEKTSKRGGRIVNEKEIMPPPPSVLSPPSSSTSKAELTIAEIMKNPAKVIWLRNMVGPGEVDSDLEPEVREECQTKYGDVHKVVIFEVPNAEEEEAVRIFVEFKRIEAAIKAVIDLNGRFFAGRQVKAGFYDVEKFANMDLND